MNVIDIEKLNQLISRTDISGNDKVKWLTDFIDGRELQQQERSYSEEELLQILESHKDVLEFDKDRFEHDRWFEQFKKK